MMKQTKRRFQSTNFGKDRDPKSIPMWKQKMFKSLRDSHKQKREQLLQRLHQDKKRNQHLSPNSKKKSANQTIDSFKRALVENEMKFQFTNSSSPQNESNNPDEAGFDAEFSNLSPDQYQSLMNEMAGFLEETELSGLRAEVARFEELQKDEEEADLEEIMASDAAQNPHIVYCPICRKGELAIEYINQGQPVYSCLCGAKFRPRDCSVSNKMESKEEEEDDDIDVPNSATQSGPNGVSKESDNDHGRRMLRSLKQNMHSLMGYHANQKGCNQQMCFAVIENSGFLQAWCTQCGCNEIVI